MADALRISNMNTRVTLTGADEPIDANQTPAQVAVATTRNLQVQPKRDFTLARTALTGAGFFAVGVAEGLASVYVAGGRNPSVASFKTNIRNWDNDWSGTRTGTVHNYLVHGVTVGVPAYWTARKMGYSPLGAAAMTGVLATGVELGQAAFNGHRPDAADALVRSIGVGFIGGEALVQLGQYADRQYGEGGGRGWGLLSNLSNKVSFSAGVDRLGKPSGSVSFATSF